MRIEGTHRLLGHLFVDGGVDRPAARVFRTHVRTDQTLGAPSSRYCGPTDKAIYSIHL
jgi:hypothetical protein